MKVIFVIDLFGSFVFAFGAWECLLLRDVSDLVWSVALALVFAANSIVLAKKAWPEKETVR